MKNIALIAAVIGASSSAFVHADSLGNLHGYATPFQQSEVVSNNGQYADAGQYGRISAYGNAINQAYEVSKGVYANIGRYGRLGGYGTSEVAKSNTVIASR